MIPFAYFDSDKFPIVTITFSGETANDANFEEYLNKITSLYERKEKCFVVIDATKGTYLASKYRIEHGKYLENSKKNIEKYVVKTFFVIPNIMIRMIMDGIFFVRPYPSPYKVCKNLEEANNWVEEQMKENEV